MLGEIPLENVGTKPVAKADAAAYRWIELVVPEVLYETQEGKDIAFDSVQGNFELHLGYFVPPQNHTFLRILV